jgi:hypothetical protein
MELFHNLLHRKARTGRSSASSAHCYFFVSSGNASLTSAFHSQFEPRARAYNGSASQYCISLHSIEEREQQAKMMSLPFAGHSYAPAKSRPGRLECTPVSAMHEVLHDIGMGALSETHVAFVSVDRKGASSVQSIYKVLRRSAMAQDIFCNGLYVTEDKEAADALIQTFNRGS